jgi:asparagine synthase (glutamine-hydrolysing)
MAHGRELRLPFLSHELVEFVFSLPPDFKIRNGRTKWILRESMKDRLPGQLVWNTGKIGFEPPQQSWMQLPAWQEAIREARRLLVEQQVLKPELLDRPVQPHGAHAAAAWDWRYFSAAALFRSL